MAINAAGKDMGPHTALTAIGNVTERTTKHTEFSCKTWTTKRYLIFAGQTTLKVDEKVH